MCDRFDTYGQTGGPDCRHQCLLVPSFHPAWLWTPKLTSPLWLSHPCRSQCYMACCWLWRTFVFLQWLFQQAINCGECQGSLATKSCTSWAQLDLFPSPLLAWALWNHRHTGLTVLLGPSTTCLLHIYTLCFFDSVMEWILRILHRTETHFDFLHLVS